MSKEFNALEFTFTAKGKADEFLTNLRKLIYKYDVATVNDVIYIYGGPTTKFETSIAGMKYGYAKKDIQKIVPEKISKSEYLVKLPAPGKMIRKTTGHWTTEEE